MRLFSNVTFNIISDSAIYCTFKIYSNLLSSYPFTIFIPVIIPKKEAVFVFQLDMICFGIPMKQE